MIALFDDIIKKYCARKNAAEVSVLIEKKEDLINVTISTSEEQLQSLKINHEQFDNLSNQIDEIIQEFFKTSNRVNKSAIL